MRELLSDAALACPGWIDFEIGGLLMGIFLGGTAGFILGIWKMGGAS